MLKKTIKLILLILLICLYAKNIFDSKDDLLGALVYNRINFALLVIILYLGASFKSILGNIATLVLIIGLSFHGYMYYKVYTSQKSAVTQTGKCHGEGTTWYSKLNDRCY